MTTSENYSRRGLMDYRFVLLYSQSAILNIKPVLSFVELQLLDL